MSVHESDGISELLDDALRLGLTAAGRIAETHIRQRQQQLTDAKAQSQHATRQLQARLDSERAAARAELAPVFRTDWWAHAQPADIQRAWQTASQWRELDPDAQRAAAHITGQLRDRSNIDVGQLQHDATNPIGADEHERTQARREQGTATGLLRRADRADTAAEADKTGPASDGRLAGYDTPQRREQLAGRLASAGVTADAIEARILDDVSHAWPPENAVDGKHDQAPEARRNRGAQARRAVKREARGR